MRGGQPGAVDATGQAENGLRMDGPRCSCQPCTAAVPHKVLILVKTVLRPLPCREGRGCLGALARGPTWGSGGWEWLGRCPGGLCAALSQAVLGARRLRSHSTGLCSMAAGLGQVPGCCRP